MSGGDRRDTIPIPCSAQERSAWAIHLSRMAILRHLGVVLDLGDEYVVRLRLAQRTPAHDGGVGTAALNGAMIAGMLDCAMSVAGILHFRGRGCGTSNLNIQFIKPVRERHPVVECVGIRRSSSLLFVEARLLGPGGRCDVMATGAVGVTAAGSALPPVWQRPEGMASQGDAVDPEIENPVICSESRSYGL